MDDLIKELESAEGPSRDLDLKIEAHLGIERTCPRLRYTFKLDEALTLSPTPADNWAINTEPCGYYASISTVRHKREYDELAESPWFVQTHGGQVTAKGATPAMAFCIAAIRARHVLATTPNLT